MTGSILGNRVLRREDPKFLTTGGVYLADMDEPLLEGALYVTYVRSTMAHATIAGIDTSEAEGMPGVVAVHTAASLGLEPAPATFNPMVTRTMLASDKVRYVGEPIAAVVTHDRAQGEPTPPRPWSIDYEPLDVLVDMEEAAASSTLIYEGAGSNVVFDSTALGMPGLGGDELFEGCDVVVSERIVNQRVAPCPHGAPRRRRRLGRRPPVPVGVDPAPPRRPRRREGRQRPRRGRGARHHAGRRRRLRGQDHQLPGGAAARSHQPRARPAGASGSRRAASRWSASTTGAPRCSASPSAGRATARCWPTGSTCSRTPAAGSTWARSSPRS